MADGSILGPRAKIWRAVEHQVAVDEAVREWFDLQPYGVLGKFNAETGWFESWIRQFEVPPLCIGAIFGDLVNNLESALDLLVYQLVLASGNRPSTGNYFPVVMMEDRWESARRDKLKGMRDEWAEKIGDMQPFHDGAKAPEHQLAIIHAANKINKHNVITPVVTAGYRIEVILDVNRNLEAGDRIEEDPSVQLPTLGTVLVGDQLLGRARPISARGDLRITGLNKLITGSLSVGYDLPIPFSTGVFPNLIEYVMGVVDEFEEVLGA